MEEDELGITLYFDDEDSEEILQLVKNHYPLDIQYEEHLESSVEAMGVAGVLSILVPLSVIGLKALKTFIENYRHKSIELKDDKTKRHIKITGYSEKESMKIINELYEKFIQ